MDAKSLLLRMLIRRVMRRVAAAAAVAAVVFCYVTGRIDPVAGIARTYAFVTAKSGGKHHPSVADEPSQATQSSVAVAAAAKLDNQTLCLAHAVYFDAGAEPREVQAAIAQVVLNRAVTPKGVTDMRALCKVVYRGLGRPLGCLFHNTCQNIGTLPEDGKRWAAAVEVAKDVAAGRAEVAPLLRYASHFHAVGPRPAWTSSVYRLTRIGRMVFYSSSPVDLNAALAASADASASAGKLGASAAAPAMAAAATSATLGSPSSALAPRAASPSAHGARPTALLPGKPRERAAAAEPARSPFGDTFQ